MRGEEVEGQEKTRRRSSKTGTETDIAMISSVAEEVNAFSASNNKACSDEGSRTNEHSNGEETRIGDRNTS